MIRDEGELIHNLRGLAWGQIEPIAYEEAHKDFVRWQLIDWQGQTELKPFIPRLFHYCLVDANAVPALVRDTFQYMTGQSSLEEFVRRLRAHWAVLDQLNSVPWPYGIRVRRDRDPHWLAPIIRPNVPIDPGRQTGQPFRQAFGTSCEGQQYARIEVHGGPEVGERAEGHVPLLARRIRLPAGLPRGARVEVTIKRPEDARMQIEVRIPRVDGAGDPWWWVEDSAGFAELVERVPTVPPEGEGSQRGLRLMLNVCLRFLKRHGHLLSSEDAGRMAAWAQQASTALVQRQEEGFKNALWLLLSDLEAVRNESVAVVLETLLVATEAPQEVTAQFEQLAALLVQRQEGPEAAMEQAWTVLDDWRTAWQRSLDATGVEDERRQLADTLFEVLQSARRVWRHGVARQGTRETAKVRKHLLPLIAAVDKALAHRELLSSEQGAALEQLNDWLALHVRVARTPARRINLVGRRAASFGTLRTLLLAAFAATGGAVLHITSAPISVRERYAALQVQIRRPDPHRDVTVARTQIVQLVADWYQSWRQRPPGGNGGGKDREADVLLDLLGALEAPELREEAVESMLQKEAFESGLSDFGSAFSRSRWTRDVESGARELVDYHLRVIEQLAAQLQEEDRYFLSALRKSVAGLSDEAEAPLREDLKGIIVMPSQPAAEPPVGEPLPCPEFDELLEVLPEALAGEECGSSGRPRPTSDASAQLP